MKLFALPFALALVAGIPPTADAQAQFLNGNDLHMICNVEGEKYDPGFCFGYAAAAHDAFQFFSIEEVCFPDEITLGQVKDVFASHLRENPEDRHQSGPWLFADAVFAAWPCP